MTTDKALEWLFGLIAVCITGGAVSWAAWISTSVNRLSTEVASLKASMLSNDQNHEKLWTQVIARFDRMDERFDVLEEKLTREHEENVRRMASFSPKV